MCIRDRAQRDSIWMKPVFDELGCTVGLLAPDQTVAQRQAAYRCDVLYATASALIFDYLLSLIHISEPTRPY